MSYITRKFAGGSVQSVIVAQDYEFDLVQAPSNTETLLEIVSTNNNIITVKGYYFWNGNTWQLVGNSAPLPMQWNTAGNAPLDPNKSDNSTIPLGGGGGLTTGRTITASTNAALTDANTLITFSHASVAGVISIDKDAVIVWPLMAVIGNYQKLAAACTFAAVGGSGVNIRGTPSGLLNAIQHVGTDEWVYL